MIHQSEEVFYSYALKNCFTNDNKYWLFNVNMDDTLRKTCHEALLQYIDRQVPVIVVTSTNVDTIMKILLPNTQ